MQPNDRVFVLIEYNLIPATVISICKKNVKVEVDARGWNAKHVRYVAPEKLADWNESIAVVWELWKGKNGRGGYRIEREHYDDRRVQAHRWPYQTYVNESSPI